MATSYPTTFPSPQLDGLSAMVDMGLIKTDRPMNQAQRRLYATMPHTFSLTFNMSISTWGLWYNWVIANGFRWFTINLPSLYAGRTGDWASPVLVRFTSDLSAVARMSCNPAIGGVAKGQITREIDALGGEMAKAIDATGIQFRIST